MRGASITAKLILSLLPLICAVLLLFGHACNVLYRGTIREEISEQLQTQLDSVAFQISGTLSEINRVSFLAYADTDLRGGLSSALFTPEEFTPSDRIDLYTEVIEPMFSLLSSPSRFALKLYPVSGEIFCDYRYVHPISSFPPQLPLDDMLSGGYAHKFFNVAMLKGNYEDTQPMLCLTRVIYHSDGSPLGVMNTEINIGKLEQAMAEIAPEGEKYFYTCLLSDGQTVFRAGESADDMITLTAAIPLVNARIRFGVSSDVIDAQTERQNRLLWYFAIAVLVIAALLIAAFSRLIMRRTHLVLNKFSSLAPGCELTSPALSGSDEAARLDQTFTRLYGDYFQSVRAQHKLKENQRMLESNLMLSRINPHFLYNTLSAIRWNLPPEDWEVVDTLVAFYRGMLAKGREIAPLTSEAELMRQYIALQRFTYSKRIDYEEDIQPDARLKRMPKFLLQPVIENAILYGGEGANTRIKLCARILGDKLIVTVQNDGAPIGEDIARKLNALNDMPPDTLSMLVMDPGDEHGYGVFNVIMRIRLMCVSGCGLWYERARPSGTLARFVLPASM